MTTAALVAVTFVALLHVYFLVLEMFLWTTPYGRFGAFTASRKMRLTAEGDAESGPPPPRDQ